MVHELILREPAFGVAVSDRHGPHGGPALDTTVSQDLLNEAVLWLVDEFNVEMSQECLPFDKMAFRFRELRNVTSNESLLAEAIIASRGWKILHIGVSSDAVILDEMTRSREAAGPRI